MSKLNMPLMSLYDFERLLGEFMELDLHWRQGDPVCDLFCSLVETATKTRCFTKCNDCALKDWENLMQWKKEQTDEL